MIHHAFCFIFDGRFISLAEIRPALGFKVLAGDSVGEEKKEAEAEQL